MPIGRDLFDRGLDPLDAAIVEFLNTRPDQAYDHGDLALQFLDTSGEWIGRLSFAFRLRSLVERGFIVSKELSDTRVVYI